MPTSATPAAPDDVLYPESDGQPMADNTRQFDWIVVLAGNLKALFGGACSLGLPSVVSGHELGAPLGGVPKVVGSCPSNSCWT